MGILSIIFIFFYTLPICIIAMLQINHIQSHSKVIILNEADFILAKQYAIIKQYLSMIEAILSGILFIFWANYGLIILSHIIAFKHDFIAQIAIVLSFIIINSLIHLPLEAYKTLIIDKSFGFSKTNIKLYTLDSLKSLFMLVIFGGLVIAGLIYLTENLSYWWVYGFVFLLIIVLLVNLIYPTIIAPIFNKFTPLEDEALKNQIKHLMNNVGFKANGVFVMDASKRDGRLNAYFGGLGKSKRVVLFDTLLNKVTHNELLAILGHELAHFKHKDLIKNIIIVAFVLFVLLFIAGNLPQTLLLQNNASMRICMLILIAPFISFYFMPLVNYFSRKAEYKADKFGATLTNKADLGNALVKLINENKVFPYSHKAFIFFYLSHPPLVERLKALDFQIQ